MVKSTSRPELPELPAKAVHAVVLAAGGSRRLGRPKQLVELDGRSLLRRAVEIALAADVASVTVVLGAREDAMAPELAGLAVRIVHNPDWQTGMGSSIRCGVRSLGQLGEADGILFLLCDQLRLSTEHLNRMITVFRERGGADGQGDSEDGAAIVASGYAGTAGVPALFAPMFRGELSHLADTQGGKQLLAQHARHVHVVPLDGGELDLDTAEDLRRAQAKS